MGVDGLRILLRRISRHGMLGMVRLVPINIRAVWRALQPRNIAARRRDRAFDRELGIDTAGTLSKGTLEAEWDKLRGATGHESVQPEIFDEMIGCLPGDLSSLRFIDLGSGKGRALVLAAQRGFAEVIGVELSPKLHSIAEKNLARIRDSLLTNVRTLNLDAREFVFPVLPSVIYLFNPFGEKILREVVGNIERIHCDSHIPVFLLYHWPMHEDVLRERGAWREFSKGHYRKDWGYVWKIFAFVGEQGRQECSLQ